MKRFFFFTLILALLLPACAAKVPATQAPTTLTVMTHDAFAASQTVITAFEQANNAKLVFLKSGDAGAALNKAILAKDAPLADVFYGVDNTFLSRALNNGIYEPYDSPLLAKIPAEYKLDPQNRALPVDYGAVCVNYDKSYFASHNLAVPQSLDDLTDPKYRGMLVVEDPAFSSTGLSFLLATVAKYGPDHFMDYWKALRNNNMAVADSWDSAYFTFFSALSDQGTYPMVVSYASSPAAEVVYASPAVSEAPTASILGPDSCFRQIEFVGILKGTKNLALAQKFVDFMLSTQFQEDMPLQMFVYPVNQEAVLPQVFVQYAQVAPQEATLDPADINANRDKWLTDWTNLFHQ